MRRAAVVLGFVVVVALLVLSKRGGLGGRAERRPTPAEEAVPPDLPLPVPAPPTLAWRAMGDVNVSRGAVEILMEREGEPDERIGTGTVGDGRYAVDLPALAEMSAFLRRRASLHASVVAPGFQPGRSGSVSLEDREPGEIRLDVTLERGAVARGRVIDEAGRAVADAEVWLSPNSVGIRDTTDAEGAFDLPLRAAGAYWLCARAGDVGAAAEGPLQLSPLMDFDAGDLVLRGPGSISGVAVYPDGTPVREMQLDAVPAELREDEFNHWPDLPFDAAKEGAAPDGLRWGWTATDGEGRFLLRGLRAGKYFFLEDKSRSIYETGTEVRVTIDAYRILVHVVDQAGAPAPGICVSAHGGGDASAGRVDDIAVHPGEVWTIGIGDMDIVPDAVTVDVIPGKREYEARLVARPVTELGRVEVRLLDPRGQPMEPLVSLYAGTTILLLDKPMNAQGRTREVPVGDYRVTAVSKDRLAPYVAAEAKVAVRAGAVTPVTLTARAGARLRLTLKGGAAGEEIRGARIAAYAAQGEGVVPFVPLHVRPDGGFTIGGAWKWEEPTTGWQLLEPGPHELRIALPGYEPTAIPLLMQPETVTDAEATLTPLK